MQHVHAYIRTHGARCNYHSVRGVNCELDQTRDENGIISLDENDLDAVSESPALCIHAYIYIYM